ncbi:hypothetical protein P389DRAFT_182313, partial [Cystobasidium minutum MCA 4210]|uniref:uncharacterized protein n=1 Tax=Cystobasidium minutum MCA 4210 TaxID=1397322 RepID=UPI0034CD8AF5
WSSPPKSLKPWLPAPNLVAPGNDFAQWFSRTFPGFIDDVPPASGAWQTQDVAPSLPQGKVQQAESFVYGPTSTLAGAEQGPPCQICQARHDLPNQKSYALDKGGYGSQAASEAPFGMCILGESGALRLSRLSAGNGLSSSRRNEAGSSKATPYDARPYLVHGSMRKLQQASSDTTWTS